MSYHRSGNKFLDIYDLTNSVLAGLVGITGSCGIVQPWEAAIIGGVTAIVGMYVPLLVVRLRIDDPVGVIPVHFAGGIMGNLLTGFFANAPEDVIIPGDFYHAGLLHGGGFYLLGIQLLACVIHIAWAGGCCLALYLFIDRVYGVRISAEHEQQGLDEVEHNMILVRIAEDISTFGGDQGESKFPGPYSPEALSLMGAAAGPTPATRGDGSSGSLGGNTPFAAADSNGGVSPLQRRASVQGDLGAVGKRRRSLILHRSERTFMTAAEIEAMARENDMNVETPSMLRLPVVPEGGSAAEAGADRDGRAHGSVDFGDVARVGSSMDMMHGGTLAVAEPPRYEAAGALRHASDSFENLDRLRTALDGGK